LSHNASPQVLDAIARALHLDESERSHLHALASTPRRTRPRRPTAEQVTNETGQLLTALGEAPAIVLGRHTRVLAWNAAGHALFAGHLDVKAPDDVANRPTMARMVFLDAHTRDLYADWPAKARAVVGNLRLMAGEHPDDQLLAALIGELTIRSPEFAALWADHSVSECDIAVHTMRHPVVGELTVAQQTLAVPLAPGQRIVVATAVDGPDADALTLLARMVSEAGRTPAPAVPAPQQR
jgi:hypothetical protein